MPSVCTRERYTYDSERKIDTFGDWPVILIKKVHTNMNVRFWIIEIELFEANMKIARVESRKNKLLAASDIVCLMI